MILPDWPAASHIKACTITALDQPLDIITPLLQQVHGDTVIEWHQTNYPVDSVPTTVCQTNLQADGIYTTQAHKVCAVKTADCLPLLITNMAGTEVAALHAGWRGLAAGIVEQGISRFQSAPEQLLVWLGPAICAAHYEVGIEVFEAFVQQTPLLAQYFTVTRPGHWQVDITAIARFKLYQMGVTQVYGGHWCTFEDTAQLYSFRRDKTNAGRLIHAIWINEFP